MMAVAFAAGVWTATRRARLLNISGDTIMDVTGWLLVSAIVGARIDYVTTYWNRDFAGQPFSEVFMIQHGGLVYYGGLIGAFIGSVIYLRWKKLPVWRIADILAPSIALGSFFGRIGCLLNGCCYGRPCSFSWAITFPPGHETHPVGQPGTPVHPTEIYDGLLNLCLYFGLAWLFRHKKFDGQVFAVYLIGYAICRSIVECFRGDYPPDHIHWGVLTPAHLLSAPILLAGILLAVFLSRQSKVKPGTG